MFGRLMPREGKYFDLFNAHAELFVQGGKELSSLIGALVDAPGEAAKHADVIDDLERQADKITHDTLAQLHTSFITPFDRDEIHQLINSMDDILDVVQDVALQQVVETRGDDGETMLVRRAAMGFHPAAGGGVGVIEGREQAIQFGRANRQEVARSAVEQGVGVQHLHGITARRARQGQVGETEAVAKGVRA